MFCLFSFYSRSYVCLCVCAACVFVRKSEQFLEDASLRAQSKSESEERKNSIQQRERERESESEIDVF